MEISVLLPAASLLSECYPRKSSQPLQGRDRVTLRIETLDLLMQSKNLCLPGFCFWPWITLMIWFRNSLFRYPLSRPRLNTRPKYQRH